MKLFLIFNILIFNLFAIEIQKAKTYNHGKYNISGWYMSEKLDGIRAYWDGVELVSKNGNKIHAPKWFIQNFPKFELDGELWTKRDDFETIQNIVLDKTPSKQWNKISYNVFEIPNQKGNFSERLNILQKWLSKNPNNYIRIIEQIECKNEKHLNIYLEELIKNKAEGIILKNPKPNYFTGRSKDVLKVKKFFDKEARVVGINHNKDGSFRSLKVKLKNNITFNLGNGFTKKQRINPPKIGDIVTFKYYSYTKYGKPKFASFLRIRKKE